MPENRLRVNAKNCLPHGQTTQPHQYTPCFVRSSLANQSHLQMPMRFWVCRSSFSCHFAASAGFLTAEGEARSRSVRRIAFSSSAAWLMRIALASSTSINISTMVASPLLRSSFCGWLSCTAQDRLCLEAVLP